mmetsp:Transcript_6794/g.6093  ORF Transcript_6794/g.6093 Transcript_6794/m.6093 type:complete len:189 (-) Transcript_6794:120-686(-)
MEKAYAKLCGSYVIAEAGFSEEAFTFLTGCPGEQIKTQTLSADELFRRCQIFDQNQFLICCGSGEDKNDVQGIVGGHAYTLISAHKVGDVRLLRIRNPWGSGEWTGDYSDKSDKWTPELKKAVGWTDEDDGTFFMTPEHFKEIYEEVNVGYYHQGYKYNFTSKVTNPGETALMKVTIKEKTTGYFRAH